MKPELVEIAMEDLQKWDSRLVELVKNSEIDPWDINIAVLTAKYMDLINHIENLDFRIPGNAVLTASVLLRLKSDHMDWQKKVHIERTREEINWNDLPIPKLKPVRRMVERKVTVFELVEALNDAFEVEKGRMGKKPVIHDLVKINQFEIGKLIDKLEARMDDLIDTVRLDEFVALLPENEFGKYDGVQYFLALLHLCNDGLLTIEQTGWNEPIYIGKLQEILPDSEPNLDGFSEEGKAVVEKLEAEIGASELEENERDDDEELDEVEEVEE